MEVRLYRRCVTDQTVPSDVADVVAATPVLAAARSLSITALEGGLSNSNWLAEADGRRYVVRIAGQGAPPSARRTEELAARSAAAAGIAPEVVTFTPEGHSVVSFVEAVETMTSERFTSPVMVARVAGLLRAIHALPAIDGAFDPYADIDARLGAIEAAGTRLPSRVPSLLERVERTRRRRAARFTPVLCHNDPYYMNVIDDGDRLWMIDWEYAGMGDPLFDLGGVAYLLDDAGREHLLAAYSGRTDDDARHELDEMTAVFLAWNITWCLVQATTSDIDHDFLDFAGELLDLVH